MSDVAPKGPWQLDDQGSLDTCTRFALSKSIANGFWTKKFVFGNEVDIEQSFILAALLAEHKVLDFWL